MRAGHVASREAVDRVNYVMKNSLSLSLSLSPYIKCKHSLLGKLTYQNLWYTTITILYVHEILVAFETPAIVC